MCVYISVLCRYLKMLSSLFRDVDWFSHLFRFARVGVSAEMYILGMFGERVISANMLPHLFY